MFGSHVFQNSDAHLGCAFHKERTRLTPQCATMYLVHSIKCLEYFKPLGQFPSQMRHDDEAHTACEQSELFQPSISVNWPPKIIQTQILLDLWFFLKLIDILRVGSQ